MRDLNGTTQSFPDWISLLEFLARIPYKNETVRDIHITRQAERGWDTTIDGDNFNGKRKHKPTSVALYDLYW